MTRVHLESSRTPWSVWKIWRQLYVRIGAMPEALYTGVPKTVCFLFCLPVILSYICICVPLLKCYGILGRQCFCGNDLDTSGNTTAKVELSFCNSTCVGNSSESCGGFWLMQVYKYNDVNTTATLAWENRTYTLDGLSVGSWVDSVCFGRSVWRYSECSSGWGRALKNPFLYCS